MFIALQRPRMRGEHIAIILGALSKVESLVLLTISLFQLSYVT